MSIAIPADVRERVIQAAQELYEQNGRESMPTVDAVRRLARVDMNAASAVMREWRRAQTAQAAPVAVTVPEVVTQAHGAALVALWQTAQELANESLRVAQAAWEAERAEADHDRQELADAYERQATELEEVRAAAERSARLHQEQQDTQAQALAAIRAELVTAATRAERAEARAQEIELRAADLRSELDHAHQEQGRIRAELAAAIAKNSRTINRMVIGEIRRIAALSEAMTLAAKAGVDPELVFNAIKGGLAGSTVMNAKAPLILERKFAPGFRIGLHIKDLDNALETAHEVGVPLPLTAGVMEILQALKVDGCAGDDHGAIVKYYEKLAKVEVRRKA